VALRPGARLLLALARGRVAALRAALGLLERLLPWFSASGVAALGDVLGTLVWLFDLRGRAVGRQNLDAVYGADKTPGEKRAILRASYRNAVRTELLLFHCQPFRRARFERFVRVDPDDLARYRAYAESGRQVVLVSAHFAAWELLALGRPAFDFAPAAAYLVESSGSREVDLVLERLRDAGGGSSALRKRGAMALRQAMAQGKSAGLLMDRNLWGGLGGVYAPFLGLEARTTPLGAVLARRFSAALSVILLLPEGPLRWRLWIGPDVMPAPSADPEADVRSALARANAMLSEVILRHPGLWLWMLKRFKARPTAERGRYPPYSQHDPDR
jgi:lauroyl/myristoyl acyltransferase